MNYGLWDTFFSPSFFVEFNRKLQDKKLYSVSLCITNLHTVSPVLILGWILHNAIKQCDANSV